MKSSTFRPTQRVKSDLFSASSGKNFSDAIAQMNELFHHDIKEIERNEAENNRLAGRVKFETTTLSLLD